MYVVNLFLLFGLSVSPCLSQYFFSCLILSQIEDAALEMFDNILRSDNVPINMEVVAEPESLRDYMEGWRMKLWEHAYVGIFKGADAFKKSDYFKDFKGANLAVKRVIYRYTVSFFL